MKSFEERRNDYYNRLRKYSKMIMELTKNKKNEKLVETLLNPQNEKELEFGNYYIMYIEDSISISVNAACDNVIEINPEDSIYVEYLSDIIKAVYNNASIEEMKEINNKYMENDWKLLTEVLYQMLVLTITNPEGLAEAIYKKCGFNFDDELEVMKFKILMNKASEQLQPSIFPVTEEKINEFISFVRHYHEFCINGIIDRNDEEVGEILSEMFPNEEPTDGYTKIRK